MPDRVNAYRAEVTSLIAAEDCGGVRPNRSATFAAHLHRLEQY